MSSPEEIKALHETTDHCLTIYREATAVLEYACTIEGDTRRGVFIKAWVEDEVWAIADFNKWHKANSDRSP